MHTEKIYSQIKERIAKFIPNNNSTQLDVYLTKRCNDAIKLAYEAAKRSGKKKVVLFEEGGWITYPQFAEKMGFEIITIKTKNCEADLKQLEEVLDHESILILHSLSGYYYPQPMARIHDICERKFALLINDCCGGISDKDLLIGDIFVCSFGRWKPLNNKSGGFIATDDEKIKQVLKDEMQVKDFTEILTPENVLSLFENLHARVDRINKKSLELIGELKADGIRVINPVSNKKLNLVVVAEFADDIEKNKILAVVQKHKQEFEECPREIRVNKKAISIEVKRID